jgi:hypothetical protein
MHSQEALLETYYKSLDRLTIVFLEHLTGFLGQLSSAGMEPSVLTKQQIR